MSDFDEIVNKVAEVVGGLLNPQSSKVTLAEIDTLKARNDLLEKLLNVQLDTISKNSRDLRAAETERDTLRAQLNALKNVKTVPQPSDFPQGDYPRADPL